MSGGHFRWLDGWFTQRHPDGGPWGWRGRRCDRGYGFRPGFSNNWPSRRKRIEQQKPNQNVSLCRTVVQDHFVALLVKIIASQCWSRSFCHDVVQDHFVTMFSSSINISGYGGLFLFHMGNRWHMNDGRSLKSVRQIRRTDIPGV